MKQIHTTIVLCLLAIGLNAQYNNLWIPDTISGTTFNLNMVDTFKQLRSRHLQQ